MRPSLRYWVRSLSFGAGLGACALTLAIPARGRAQEAAPAAQQQSGRCSSSIDGHVVDVATHEPIAGATVRVDGKVVALTDAGGHFAVSRLCAGERIVEVVSVGHEMGHRTIALADGKSQILELELKERLLGSDVIVIEADAPASIDMRSTAVVAGEALERTRGRSFSDALAEVPGVSQLRSASGLAKPIVRGHYGRRLMLLVDGVRHRSQDWGLDHAPEIDPFVADQLSVVRGAAGVRFGPDAIGGAVLVDPPRLRYRPGYDGEAHFMGFYGRGAGLAARVKAAAERVPNLAWLLEGSARALAAPFTPDYALDNTGSREWNLGASLGHRTVDGEYTLSYRRYQAKLGVCRCLRIESSEDFFAQLERKEPIDAHLYESELGIERPRQAVAHDLVMGRARRELPNVGTVHGTYALQYDSRQEFDVVRDATGPQFDFRLTTHDLEVGFEHKTFHLSDHLHLRGSTGVVGMAQEHQYSGLTLVPDHQAWAGGIYAIERLLGHDFELEAGVRYDATTRSASLERRDFLRLVRSDQIGMNACSDPEADPVECRSSFHTLSASVGGLYQITQPWSVKLELSTASRPPNPDEQYLNGTSPTFPVFGLGKPDLRPETTYAASATTTYQGERVAGEASVYGNYIDDYIYFAPAIGEDGRPIFDVLVRGSFPRFVTRPVDAVFYGFDGGVTARPWSSLELGGQLSVVRARNATDRSFLVFVPPTQLRGSASYSWADAAEVQRAFVSLAGTYVARQTRFDLAADLARPPDAYFLLDAELGAQTRAFDQTIKLALHGTNLTKSRYRDYTSLLRYFADQPGFQIMLRLSLHFGS